MTRKPEKTYNDMTPAERAAFDQRYRVAEARKVMKRIPARIRRLRKIEASLRAELRRFNTNTNPSDGYAAGFADRSLSCLLEAIGSDERQVATALSNLGIAP